MTPTDLIVIILNPHCQRYEMPVDEVEIYVKDFQRGTEADELIIGHRGVSVESRLRSVELTGNVWNAAPSATT